MKTKHKNTIICELSVIEKIIIDYLKLMGDEEPSQIDLSISQQWYSLITSHSILIIECEKKQFTDLAETNHIFKKLLKSSLTGGSQIEYWKNHFEEIEKDKRIEDFPNALYLLNRTDNFCDEKISEYGMIFLNGRNYRSCFEKLFFHTDIQVKKEIEKSDIHSWSDMRQHTQPMNCLILLDNYIIKEAKDIKLNLIPLLDALLPKNLVGLKFQLMIITLDMDQGLFLNRYSEIYNQIRSLNRTFEIELSLITSTKEFLHDRRIFSNYFMLESNNSFTYFANDGKIQKNTSLHIFPSCMISSKRELQINSNLITLSEVKEIVINHSRKQTKTNPESKNRLLSII